MNRQVEKLAYLGPKASFTHEAALWVQGKNQKYRHLQLVPVTSITEYCELVAKGNIDYGIAPIENSTDGPVNETLEAFRKHKLYVHLEHSAPIRQGLYYRRDADLLSVRKCISKGSANGQCRGKVSRLAPNADFDTRNSTIAALLEAADNPEMAALAPLGAGEAHGLMDKMALIADVHDDPLNATRFWLFSAKENKTPLKGNNKTSMIVQMQDEAGTLYTALDVFVAEHINLAKIKSFGREKNSIAFLMTVQGHQQNLPLRSALNRLYEQNASVQLLGSYPASDYRPPYTEQEVNMEYAIAQLRAETSNGIHHEGKTVVVFTLKDEIGALRNALYPFKQRKINLTEIDSLPTGKLGEYVFYLAFMNGVNQRAQAIDELTTQCTKVVVL